MNDKIGRNELCPCGSGKKYKHCCLATTYASAVEVVDFEWHHLRKLEGEIVDQHLIPYVAKELSKEVMHAALSDLMPENLPQELDRDIYFPNFFMPLFLFNWLSEEGFKLTYFNAKLTIAQNYLKTHEKRLNNREKRFIEQMGKTYYSFYSILDVEYEKSLTVKDILLGTTHHIKERQGTHHLKRGDIVFSRILTMDQCSIFIGMAPFTLPIKYHSDLIDFRKWLIEEIDEPELTTELLCHEVNLDVLGYFFDAMIEAFERPMPTLANTDGDLLQFCTSHFELVLPLEESLNQLLPLTLSKDPIPYLTEAMRDKTGEIKSLQFPWLKKGNKKNTSWETTILGEITLESGKLKLKTNSEKRAKKGRQLLEKYLGKAIIFQTLLIEAPEKKIESTPALAKKDQDKQAELMAMPEVQAQIKVMAQAHWQSLFDQSIPALDNQTPRQAAKTKGGREKLEALLLQYERYDMDRKTDDPFKADMHYLRTELAMDKE